MTITMPISQARSSLAGLSHRLHNKDTATITSRGKPILAVIPWELFESVTETLEIMGDYKIIVSPTALKMLKEISDRRIQTKIGRLIDGLSRDPEQKGKPLWNELSGFRSLRQNAKFVMSQTLSQFESAVDKSEGLFAVGFLHHASHFNLRSGDHIDVDAAVG